MKRATSNNKIHPRIESAYFYIFHSRMEAVQKSRNICDYIGYFILYITHTILCGSRNVRLVQN